MRDTREPGFKAEPVRKQSTTVKLAVSFVSCVASRSLGPGKPTWQLGDPVRRRIYRNGKELHIVGTEHTKRRTHRGLTSNKANPCWGGG